MNFWNVDGATITGNAKDAFTPSFAVIPDGTQAVAMIDDIIISDHYDNHINISWKLTTGEFLDRIVFQKIKVFEADSKKRIRALNMFMLLHKLTGVQLSQSEPSAQSIAPFKGKYAGIVIQEWDYEGKNGNYISEIYAVDGFESKTGTKIEITSVPKPISAIAQELAVDDVPW